MNCRLHGVILLAALLVAGTARAEVPRVLVSIAPLHSLASAVMAGVGQPDLLVPGNVSDHDYAMRPSDLRKIAGADLVIWVGGALETYLDKPLRTEGVPALAILEAPGVEPRVYAAGGEEPHSHAEGEEHGHEHLGLDPHVWLDPIRSQAVVSAIAERLSELDGAHAEAYRRNAEATKAQLQALDAEIRTILAPVSVKLFITFHDGYGYFVARYGLHQAGRLSVHPEQQAGAASLRALKEQVVEQKIVCAFAEPQFDPEALEALVGNAEINVGVLDAIGADLEPGPGLYGQLLRKNAGAIAACLTSTS
jgi:zinc transport system substrate-binding protein